MPHDSCWSAAQLTRKGLKRMFQLKFNQVCLYKIIFEGRHESHSNLPCRFTEMHTLDYLVYFAFIASSCSAATIFQNSSANHTSMFTSAFPIDLLSLSIIWELTALAGDPDPGISQAKLVRVRFRSCGPWIESSDIADFRLIMLELRTGVVGPPDPFKKYVSVINQAPQHWQQWSAPKTYTHASPLYDKLDLEWEEIQQSMKLLEAYRFLQEAGYRGYFSAVEVAASRVSPLRYCFEKIKSRSPPFNYHAVSVNVLTTEVKEHNRPGCP